MNSKTLKLIGILSTVLGAGVTVLSGWVEEQKMKETVREEVELALSARESIEEIES